MRANPLAVAVSAILLLPAGHSSVCQGQVAVPPQVQRSQTAGDPLARTRLPDLVVSRISVSPVIATPRDRITITVEIRNAGNAPAVIPPGRPVWTAAKPNGGSVGPAPKGETVAPGQASARSIVLVNAGELRPGTYRIPMTVDPANVVRESNEANNQPLFTLTLFPTDWRTALRDAVALSRTLHGTALTKDLAARIEAELRYSEAAMLAAERMQSGGPAAGSPAARSAIQDLGARRRGLNDLSLELDQARAQLIADKSQASKDEAAERMKQAMEAVRKMLEIQRETMVSATI